jgi:hypothetical protein
MTYACSAWDFAAEYHLLKLQRLQNKVIRNAGNFPRRTPIRDLHMAFKLPYIYDYTLNYEGNKQKSYNIVKMQIFATLDKASPDTENIRGLKLAAVNQQTFK